MNHPHLIQVARFVRDLLQVSESLIKFDREDIPQDDFDTSYIVINGSSISNKQATGKTYNSTTEKMTYDALMSQDVILEFYGELAYENANRFSLLNASQKAADLKRKLLISISHIKSATDVKQIIGSAYGNRIHLEMNVNYSPSLDVETLRIDSSEFGFKEDK